jgi:hypothetical protein
MVDYTVVLNNIVCYVIGYIRDINVIADRAVVKERSVNAGGFGCAAEKGDYFVEFAKFDFA